MSKKLYRVKVVLYVMAENESEASVAATNAQFDIFECSAKRAEHVDRGWENAIPYNSEDDRTCDEILSGQQLAHSGHSLLVGTGRQRTTSRHLVL